MLTPTGPANQPLAVTRRGFTLIELMVVIVVIAILLALLLPAIQGAVTKAREARVKTEIMQLDTAIGQFKQTYGVEPPSRISIYEAYAGWTGDAASMATIRRIWPQFDFTDQDRNGNGNSTDSITLSGSECLVFFLGGLITGPTPLAPTVPTTCTGFSKNPSSPGLAGGSRDGPFLEFDSSRLRAAWDPTNTPQPSGTYARPGLSGFQIAIYLDPSPDQSNPYLYFSSYEGQGYRTTGATREAPVGANGVVVAVGTVGAFADVYRVVAGGAAYKPQSYQIISSGLDGLYGGGGLYNPKTTNAGLSNPADYDNLTNFNNSRLKP